MRPDRLALLLVALAACLAFPARAASTVSGEPLAVGPFHALEVSGHAEVILIEGGETPSGIVTALVGAPLFILLARREKVAS